MSQKSAEPRYNGGNGIEFVRFEMMSRLLWSWLALTLISTERMPCGMHLWVRILFIAAGASKQSALIDAKMSAPGFEKYDEVPLGEHY